MLGASGRAMPAALAEGETDPETLAGLARGRVREKTRELQEALRGLMGSRQRFMLVSQLGHLECPDTEIERLDAEVARRVSPFEATVAAVDTIPRVGRRTAQVIAAEVGTDMKQFPTPGHLASWAGVVGWGVSGEPPERGKAPAQPGTEGEQLAETGPPFSRGQALVEAARAAGRTKTYLGAQYRRLARRIGAQRAAMAVAHNIAVILHHVIKTGRPFVDLGRQYFEKRDEAAITRRAVGQLERLGHKVTLQEAQALYFHKNDRVVRSAKPLEGPNKGVRQIFAVGCWGRFGERGFLPILIRRQGPLAAAQWLRKVCDFVHGPPQSFAG